MELLLVFPAAYDLTPLSNYLQRQNIAITVHPSTRPFTEYHAVLAFTPYYHEDTFVNPANVWDQYLTKSRGAGKVMLWTTGLLENCHPTYLDLLKLPGDFRSYAGQQRRSAEQWQNPIRTPGIDANLLLLKLYEGHQADSLLPPLAKVRMKLKLLEYKIAGGSNFAQAQKSLSSSDNPTFIQDSWNELCSRWDAVYEKLRYLPFENLINDTQKRIESLTPFFNSGFGDEQVYFDLSVSRQFEELFSTLVYIRKYVTT